MRANNKKKKINIPFKVIISITRLHVKKTLSDCLIEWNSKRLTKRVTIDRIGTNHGDKKARKRWIAFFKGIIAAAQPDIAHVQCGQIVL